MSSLWNRMKSGPLLDREIYGKETSDNTVAQSRASSALVTSSKENNVNKSESAPQPRCEERIHYPIYDPLNPRHNPVVARSRSTIWPSCFPPTPRSKAANSLKRGSWAERSPARSLRRVKSGFLAFTEELRSKPSHGYGDGTSKTGSPSRDPADPLKKGSKDPGDCDITEAERLSPDFADTAPVLELNFAASSQMSLSPFAPSPTVSTDKTLPYDGTNAVTATYAPSTSSRPLTTVATPIISCSGPSFLPIPEVYSPLEDPFQSPANQPTELRGEKTPNEDQDGLTDAPPEPRIDRSSTRTNTSEENSQAEIKSCSERDIEHALKESMVGSADVPPAKVARQQEDSCEHPTVNSSKIDNDQPPLQDKPLESSPMTNPGEPRSSILDGPEPAPVNTDDTDNNKPASKEQTSEDLAGFGETDKQEMLAEISTDEDSDFGVEIYRTMCLGEGNTPPSDTSGATTIPAELSSPEEDGKSERIRKTLSLSQSSRIPTSSNPATDHQSMQLKELSSNDSSNKSTIRWRDGYTRREVQETGSKDSSAESNGENETSEDSGREVTSPTSTTSRGEGVDGSDPNPIGVGDQTSLAPCGDLHHSVEANERVSGFELTESPESLPLPVSRGSLESERSSNHEEDTLREGGEETTNRSTRSESREATHGLDESDPRNSEMTPASLENSVPSATSRTARNEESPFSDGGTGHGEISRGNSTESSQADIGSDDTAAVKIERPPPSFGSYTISNGLQPAKEQSKKHRTSRASTDANDDMPQDPCYRIISDGSIHSGPGLDRDDPSSTSQRVLPEAIGPGSLLLGGNKSRGSQSNAPAGRSSDSEDQGFAAWYAQKERPDR
ncbi:hypothetical protein FQN54_002859 [Arachnomyces sp. PD_36]|nr:hypothetical protein FQN54_002859 [Arachnomyces sp. PD_36]